MRGGGSGERLYAPGLKGALPKGSRAARVAGLDEEEVEFSLRRSGLDITKSSRLFMQVMPAKNKNKNYTYITYFFLSCNFNQATT